MVTIIVNGVRREIKSPDDTPLLYVLEKRSRTVRTAVRLRTGPVRRLLGSARRQGSPLLHNARLGCGRQGSHHARRAARALGAAKGPLAGRCREDASPGSTGVDRGTDAPVRLLPERHDDQGDRAARTASPRRPSRKSKRRSRRPVRRRTSAAAEATPPSSKPCSAPRTVMAKGGKRWTTANEKRQCFRRHSDAPRVRQGGRRAVGRLRHCGRCRTWNPSGRRPRNTLDPTLPGSWIEIHPDNTILIRTGKSDFGQGTTFTAYRQIVAEELSAPFEAITTVVMGDTDRTPDGSGAFDFLGRGTPNIRKAAAYTYQALLDLASQRLGVAKSQLSVKDGIVSGGGKSISYGDLVKGQQLKLTIPVSGDLTSIMGLTVTGNPPHEAGQRIHRHRQVVSQHRHRVESHRAGEMGHRRPAARHAARAHGASEDARLEAHLRRRSSTRPAFPTRRSS